MLNLGLENLQVTNTTVEEPVVLTDVLSCELEFQEAYQAFVDYKNVCEIVVKAKASNEGLAFAGELLNVSVESIEVSSEDLAGKFKAAWTKFVELWNKFVAWFKGAITRVASTIKDIRSPVPVSPTLNGLKSVLATGDKAFAFIEKAKTDNNIDPQKDVEQITKFFNDIRSALNTKGVIASKQEASEWITTAKSVIKFYNQVIVDIKSKYRESMLLFTKEERKNDTRGNDKGAIKNPFVGLRYLMIIGPIVIKKVRETMTKLSGESAPKADNKNEPTDKD